MHSDHQQQSTDYSDNINLHFDLAGNTNHIYNQLNEQHSMQDAFDAQQQLALAAAAAADLAVRHAEAQKAAVTALANANALALRRNQQRYMRSQQDLYQQQPQQYQYQHQPASQIQTPQGQEFQNFDPSHMSPMSGPGDLHASFALEGAKGFEDDEFSFTPLISPAMTPSYPFGPSSGILPGNMSFSPLTSPALHPSLSGDCGPMSAPAMSLDNPLTPNVSAFPTSSRRTSTSLRNQIAHAGSIVGNSMKRPMSSWAGSSKKRCDSAGQVTQHETNAECPQISAAMSSAVSEFNIAAGREHMFTAPSFSLDMGAPCQNSVLQLQQQQQQRQPQMQQQHLQNERLQHNSNSKPILTTATPPALADNDDMLPAVLGSPLHMDEALYQQAQSSLMQIEQHNGQPSVSENRQNSSDNSMPPPRLSPTTGIDTLSPVTPASLMHLSGKNTQKSRTRNSITTNLHAASSHPGNTKTFGSSFRRPSSGTPLVSPSLRPGTTAMSPHLGPNAMSQLNLVSPSLRPTHSNANANSQSKIFSPSLRPMISPSSKPSFPGGTNFAITDPDAIAKLTAKSNYEILKSAESTTVGAIQQTDLDSGLELRRTTHKAAEQKRRDTLKQSFANLRDMLPKITERNPNKIFLLEKASEYIRDLGAELRKKDEQIASLKALVPEALRPMEPETIMSAPASDDVGKIDGSFAVVDNTSPSKNVADDTENRMGATNEKLPEDESGRTETS